MYSITKQGLFFWLVCGFFVAMGGSLALAQTVDVNGPTAGSTAKTESGVTTSGNNPTAGKATEVLPKNQGSPRVPNRKMATSIIPKSTPHGGAGNTAPLNGDESGLSPRANTSHATSAVAQADETAHKTVYDPNDQLGILGGASRTSSTPTGVAGASSGHGATAPASRPVQ
jgi:hypothetical protein